MEGITIRPFEPSEREYEEIVALSNSIFADYPESVDELRYEDRICDQPKYRSKRLVAVDESTGRIVGRADRRHRVWSYDPARFAITVEVDEAYRRRGIGTGLLAQVEHDARSLGGLLLEGEAFEGKPEGSRFLERHGFAEISREWESRLDLQGFDEGPFRYYRERFESSGLKVSTLAAERNEDPEWLLKLYALQTGAEKDIPSPHPYTPPQLDEFVAHIVEAPSTIPEALFLAKDGDRYVGLSALGRTEVDDSTAFQNLTAVHREYRGRGIAFALKLEVIGYARRAGYHRLITWNSTLNAPMLAVNTKLGFVRQPAWVNYAKSLSGTKTADAAASEDERRKEEALVSSSPRP